MAGGDDEALLSMRVGSPVAANEVCELPGEEEEPNPQELTASVEDWNTLGRLPLQAGTFDWLRKSNGPEDRALRRRAAVQTMKACQEGSYIVDGKEILLNHLQAAVDGTCTLRLRDAGLARARRRWLCGGGAGGGSPPTRWFQHAPGLAPRVALECAQAGGRVALVNAASAYQIGGGFRSGGRHALEEALCTQSTLFECLVAAKDKARAQECHIPEDGVVLSPHVEVFRGGTFDGYPFLASPAKLSAVVSVAMPNFNLGVRDTPVDRLSQHAYEKVLSRKFAAVLEACRRAGAEVVVMPDVGCGVYQNDPLTVGRIFASVLRSSFARDFAEVHLVGQPCFTCAAQPANEQKRHHPRCSKRKSALAWATMRSCRGCQEGT